MGTTAAGERWGRVVAACLLVALEGGSLGGGRALAAAKEETPERRAAAAEFKRGKQLFAAKDYTAALEAFMHGYELSPLRGFLVNIAQCQRRLGQLREAAESYEKFLEGQGGSASLRAEVEEALAEVKEAERVAARNAPAPQRTSPPPVGESLLPPPGRSADAPESSGATLTTSVTPHPRRRWVIPVAVTTALVVVGGVAVGAYFGYRTTHPAGGSLGLVDGRSP